jgi:hypothetical protein
MWLRSRVYLAVLYRIRIENYKIMAYLAPQRRPGTLPLYRLHRCPTATTVSSLLRRAAYFRLYSCLKRSECCLRLVIRCTSRAVSSCSPWRTSGTDDATRMPSSSFASKHRI